MTRLSPHNLPPKSFSKTIFGPDGQPAVRIESLPISVGQRVQLTFESVNSPRRQGVRLMTVGELAIDDDTRPQFVLWPETADPSFDIMIRSTDGALRFYNVWESGDNRGRSMSLSHTSGMLVEQISDTERRYSCNDVGFDPDFSKLVFRINITDPVEQ